MSCFKFEEVVLALRDKKEEWNDGVLEWEAIVIEADTGCWILDAG